MPNFGQAQKCGGDKAVN